MKVKARPHERSHVKQESKVFYCAAVGFEAARNVDILPPGHRSRRLHGHSFIAKVRAPFDSEDAPFQGAQVRELRKLLAKCVAPLDYEFLNSHIATPTDENIARWIRGSLGLREVDSIGIQSTVHE